MFWADLPETLMDVSDLSQWLTDNAEGWRTSGKVQGHNYNPYC